MVRGMGRMIRRIREKKGLTQDALARKVDVSEEYISMLERGERKNPSLGLLQRFSKRLGVDMRSLVGSGPLLLEVESLGREEARKIARMGLRVVHRVRRQREKAGEPTLANVTLYRTVHDGSHQILNMLKQRVTFSHTVELRVQCALAALLCEAGGVKVEGREGDFVEHFLRESGPGA